MTPNTAIEGRVVSKYSEYFKEDCLIVKPTPHPQLSIKSKQVYASPTSTYETFLESLGQDLSNPPYIGLISGVILTLYQ